MSKVALLGILYDVGGHRAQRTFIGMATTLAKRDIARHWMAKTPPTIEEWRRAMDWSAKIEEPVYIARGCPMTHKQLWGGWWSYYGLNGD